MYPKIYQNGILNNSQVTQQRQEKKTEKENRDNKQNKNFNGNVKAFNYILIIYKESNALKDRD